MITICSPTSACICTLNLTMLTISASLYAQTQPRAAGSKHSSSVSGEERLRSMVSGPLPSPSPCSMQTRAHLYAKAMKTSLHVGRHEVISGEGAWRIRRRLRGIGPLCGRRGVRLCEPLRAQHLFYLWLQPPKTTRRRLRRACQNHMLCAIRRMRSRGTHVQAMRAKRAPACVAEQRVHRCRVRRCAS